MILYGQYDSPFVRRAAFALTHHGLAFERRVLSVFTDFDEMLAVNPLGKVPVLERDDGMFLVDSRAIIEDIEASAMPEKRLTPSQDDARREMLLVEAVAIGLAEKTYERGIEFSRKNAESRDEQWVKRLERQISSALDCLEARVTPGWFVGDTLTRADLAAVAATSYLANKQPALYNADARPHLEAFRSRCETASPFVEAPYSADEAAASGWKPERT